jgi:nucleotide-binding universal stress UspA family protein
MSLSNKSILVPTDFSQAAENAADYAVQLANDLKAQVLLLHVFQPPVSLPDSTAAVVDFETFQQANEAEMKELVAKLEKKSQFGVQGLVRMGFASEEILTEEKNALAIVMGMKGENKLREIFIGSLVTNIMKNTEKPLLVIPAEAKYTDFENVVMACDLDKETDKQAFESLKCFLKPFASTVHIVHVMEDKKMSDERQKTIAEIKELFVHQEVSFVTIDSKDLLEGLENYLKDAKADLVAVVPHKYYMLDRLFHKSISKKLAFHTRVPLLALPEKHYKPSTFII